MEGELLPEQVPIPIDELIRIKTLFANVGLAFIAQFQATEPVINAAVAEAASKAGIDPKDFGGIDIAKGVFITKPKRIEVA